MPPTGNPDFNASWPPPPDFSPLITNVERQRVFGRFVYQSNPIPGNPENITITSNWLNENIVPIILPQLIGISGAPRTGRVFLHKKAAPQIIAFFAEIEEAGLLGRITNWGGAFVPRLVRGSKSLLSNHAFGSAFDINTRENTLGAEPAALGEPGCVRELVPIAHRHGIYWGGHFTRKDGMHFEVAVIQP